MFVFYHPHQNVHSSREGLSCILFWALSAGLSMLPGSKQC